MADVATPLTGIGVGIGDALCGATRFPIGDFGEGSGAGELGLGFAAGVCFGPFATGLWSDDEFETNTTPTPPARSAAARRSLRCLDALTER